MGTVHEHLHESSSPWELDLNNHDLDNWELSVLPLFPCVCSYKEMSICIPHEMLFSDGCLTNGSTESIPVLRARRRRSLKTLKTSPRDKTDFSFGLASIWKGWCDNRVYFFACVRASVFRALWVQVRTLLNHSETFMELLFLHPGQKEKRSQIRVQRDRRRIP